MLIEMAIVNGSAGYAQHRHQRQYSPGHSQQMDKTRCRHPVGFIFSILLFLTQLDRLASSCRMVLIRQLLARRILGCLAQREPPEASTLLDQEVDA